MEGGEASGDGGQGSALFPAGDSGGLFQGQRQLRAHLKGGQRGHELRDGEPALQAIRV